jgi:hypothetical protein
MSEIRRIDYAGHLERAAPRSEDDPGRAGLLANEAARLVPLQRIQTAFDQTIVRADTVARGGAWEYTGGLREHVASTLEYVRRSLDVLRTAAAAAEAMIDDFTAILTPLTEENMSQDDPNKGPQLTTTGEPHPLQKGGYDPHTDPTLQGNISDIEALKEGKTTPAQAEALAAADTEGRTSDQPPKSTEELQAERSQQATDGTDPLLAAEPNAAEMPPPADEEDPPRKGRRR